jgi:prepilin-type N-terminal cleavage/methylation domain-containing protein
MKSKTQKGFTLIELLVVIAVVGVLASLVLVSLNSARVKSRDAKRKTDLTALQKAIELYYTTNNSYPTTGGVWFGATGGCGGNHGYTGATGYIPNLAPNYVGVLPRDPKPSTGQCSGYVYRSDGNNYKLISNVDGSGLGGPETFPSAGQPFYDPAGPGESWMVTNNAQVTATW